MSSSTKKIERRDKPLCNCKDCYFDWYGYEKPRIRSDKHDY